MEGFIEFQNLIRNYAQKGAGTSTFEDNLVWFSRFSVILLVRIPSIVCYVIMNPVEGGVMTSQSMHPAGKTISKIIFTTE